ncbi:MAG TPA: GNAT family N-acetyltransferase [Calditrichia bacterium]|nr:GNAT family N-acetyltransferase [Calditrichota bacterium]HQU70718.1 GNAT family N-acetyltransferase [Calditrichia bacterium]HQV31671.1 GNAT family N-acetyltransferase [Calditrichia bacterium]
MSNPRQKYRELCKAEERIPLCSRDWWLDAVAGPEGWDVVLAESGSGVVGALPYVLKRKWLFFNVIQMPRFSTGMGVWLQYPPDQKYHSRLSFEARVISELIEQLPPFHRFFQRFQPDFTNWLPFFWKGFEQTTRYTYVLKDLSDPEALFRGFRDNIRREIRKAAKIVSVCESEDAGLMYHMNSLTFKRQGREMPFSLQEFARLDEALKARNSRRIFLAKDQSGNLHSALYLMYDAHCAYYLMGGSDPGFRNSGAASLLMWEAIKFAAGVSRKFDFEGSMMAPVERFFRAFGAVQTPYFSIYKNNWFFKVLDTFRTKK